MAVALPRPFASNMSLMVPPALVKGLEPKDPARKPVEPQSIRQNCVCNLKLGRLIR